jgi:hypothetical protein
MTTTYTSITKSSIPTFTNISKVASSYNNIVEAGSPSYSNPNKSSSSYSGISKSSAVGTTPSLIDSHGVENVTGAVSLNNSAFTKLAHSILVSGDSVIYKVSFYLKRSGTIAGNVVSKIYATSGIFGTSSIPTGTALATSDNVVISSIDNSAYVLVDFYFTGVNVITLSRGSNYCVSIEPDAITAPSFIGVDLDQGTSVPNHNGNLSLYLGGVWYSDADSDTIFYLYAYTSYNNILKS